MIRRAGFSGEFEWDRLAANIDRWQNVPIPPLLALGSKCLDRVARLAGRDYRLILFARKETSTPKPSPPPSLGMSDTGLAPSG